MKKSKNSMLWLSAVGSLLVAYFIYSGFRINKLKSAKCYAVGEVTSNTSGNGRGDVFVEYMFKIDGEAYEGSTHIGREFNRKEIRLMDKYLVKYVEDNPNISKMLLDKKVKNVSKYPDDHWCYE